MAGQSESPPRDNAGTQRKKVTSTVEGLQEVLAAASELLEKTDRVIFRNPEGCLVKLDAANLSQDKELINSLTQQVAPVRVLGNTGQITAT